MVVHHRMKRQATAVWNGSGLEGSGKIDSPGGFFDATPYTTKTRFQNEDGKLGTSPEEMLAAAHAACFCMALSFAVGSTGHTAKELKTNAIVSVDQEGMDYFISKIDLFLFGEVPGMDVETFEKLANGVKDSCPISKALQAVPIHLSIEFKG